ncbi:MAG: hypothetical protein ACYDC3_06870 [Candidatus Binataceae bacterium]
MKSKLCLSRWSISYLSGKSAFLVAIGAALAFLVAGPAGSRAQDSASSMAQSAQQAASTLTGSQRSAANSALCAAVGSQVPNAASADPSILSNPTVVSTAATTFAGSTSLPLSSATTMLQSYIAAHATDILASCAVSNATGGLTSKIPGASSMPSMPNMP